MKIYKYTSLTSAVAILRNGGVALSNPEFFNDPNDCSFVQDEKDKKKIERLITDYFVYKVVSQLASFNKITLNTVSKIILSFLQKEIDFYKKSLAKAPYFEKIPGFRFLGKEICSRSDEANKLVSKEKNEFQKDLDSTIKKARDSALVSCFSKRNNSILMWSHYADSHKGVCIEYERPDSNDFRDVIYKSKRPTIKLRKAVAHKLALDILGKKEDEKELYKYLKDTLDPFFVKSTDWEYEEEVRCLYTQLKLDENIKTSDDGKRLILEMDTPTAIYIGCKASGEELDHVYELAKNRGIPIYFMKKSDSLFDVVIDENHEYKPTKTRKEQEITLLRLIKDINGCLNQKLYLAAFSASLIIPAICSSVELSEIKDPKSRYIKWCEMHLPYATRENAGKGLAFVSGEVLWNIKEKLFSEGNVEVLGHYNDFDLRKLSLRVEKRKGFDLYCEMLGEDEVTFNITKFCCDTIYLAKKCYEKYHKKIKAMSQLPIEDFDDEIESLEECAIATETLKKSIKKDR